MTRVFQQKWQIGLFVMLMVFSLMVCSASSASDNSSEISCEEYTIPVTLKANNFLKHDVVGKLCWAGDLDGQALYVLVSGSTYGQAYWDFPIQKDIYSFVRAAAAAGYATFNLSRIGMGASDRPFGFLVDVDANAYIVHQTIAYLNDTVFEGLDLGPVVTVGHSLGSVITVGHAVQFPQDVAGVILTGFIHNINPNYGTIIRDATHAASADDRFTGKRYDFTYMTTKPGYRNIFYALGQADPDIITVDELTKETTTLGEIASTRDYYGEESLQIEVPVLQLIGDEDIVGCGGEIDCQDHDAIIANEQAFFSEAACIETHVIESTGHNLNLHPNAPSSYQTMLDWFAKRVGAGHGVPRRSHAPPCRKHKSSGIR